MIKHLNKAEPKCFQCEAFIQKEDILNIDGICYLRYIYPLLREITNRTKEEKALLSRMSEKFNVVGNERVTTNIPKEYKHTIYIFGKSEVFGKGVEDSDTIASYLQKMVNKQYPDTYRVVNKGVSAIFR